MSGFIFSFLGDLGCSYRDEGSGSDLGSGKIPISLWFFLVGGWNFRVWCLHERVCFLGCSAEKLDKNGHLFGFILHTYFFFWAILRIFVPRLEIIFCCNNYFLVYIF